MKIVVLQGSLLVNDQWISSENFIKWANEKRYEVRSFKVSKMNIKPCLGWVAKSLLRNDFFMDKYRIL